MPLSLKRYNVMNRNKTDKIIIPVRNTEQIIVNNDILEFNQGVTEPFTAGRDTSRLFFDFSVMISLLKETILLDPVLDFGAGTGWITEFCVRMGLQTVALDIHNNLKDCLENRGNADIRINTNLISFAQGDGHNMPFDSDTFGHLLCYDTLHHMHNYNKVFSEFFRVLKKGGRAIFVEPGARHSTSPETIKFLADNKDKGLDWIERDVVLEEIDKIAREAGFSRGISIVPVSNPATLQVYSIDEWSQFREGDNLQRLRIIDQLAHLNYWDRVIFYVDKSE